MENLSVKITNYKCFKEESGFDEIKRVNLIIGRNNSGKSTLVDLIEYVINTNYDFPIDTYFENNKPKIIFESPINIDIIDKIFQKSSYGGPINGNHNEYGKQYINKKLKWTKDFINNSINYELLNIDEIGITNPLTSMKTSSYLENILRIMPIFFEKKIFKRLNAERDITPEKSNHDQLNVNSNGEGITNVIQNFINNSSLPSDIVEVKILTALNEIFAHDGNFSDIVCQHHSNLNIWEIYLEGNNKRVALSRSGSGLKTIISVLTYLYLIPHLEKKSLDNYIFVFEELENNIHPALLRRLNNFIYQYSLEKNFIYFLTTHSNVMIDQFSKQNDAQIIHVTQDNGQSKAKKIQTYIENNGILDDLDVRASDLLQSNGIIWVEGPSDRIYLNRWIDLWSNSELHEGTHYQIIFYGGRLLSHLSGDDPTHNVDGIKLLNTNKNAIMVIDSDKKNANSKINETKKRIKEEFDSMNSFCWITKGKEIENYLPVDIINDFFKTKALDNVKQFQSFFDYLDNIKNGEGKKYESKKPLLAEKLITIMSKENMKDMLDLNQMMEMVIKNIKKWNSL